MIKKILLLLSGGTQLLASTRLNLGSCRQYRSEWGSLLSTVLSLPICAAAKLPDTFDFTRRARDSLLTDYRAREKFFNDDDWSFEQDFDGDCQSTRQEMLILTSRSEVRYTNPRNCVVRTGEWFDEYTGEMFEVAVQIDIDHVIPRMYAHTHGGDRWMPEMKLQFSNDPLNLMLIESREIRRKRDRGPSRYLPRDEFQCEYVNLWNQLSEKYRLQLSSTDRSTISRILDDCPEFNSSSDN